TARMMAAQGATVCLLSITPLEETDIVADAIKAAGGVAASFQCDVADRAAVDRCIGQIEKTYERIDVLVNCAGVFLPNPIFGGDSADVERTLNVNLKGTYNTVHAVLPIMRRAGGGSIVNVASAAAKQAVVGTSMYAASKAAVIAFTRTVAGELKGLRIRINAVAPGAIRTPMVAAVHTRQTPEAEKMYRFLADATPSPYGEPFLEPEDVASAICFLASDAARGVHGATLVVDQGLTAVAPSPQL
ncbi:MAG: SDR family NAD(P)-dependent oxidoreductase, partial [Steroidobacteraceae bacterium]